jgi:hypothetical protein
LYVLEWTSIAITSGVVGNAAYDAVQSITDRAIRRRRFRRYPRLAEDDALLVARTAVVAFCGQRGDKIDPAEVRVSSAEQGPSRSWYIVITHAADAGSAIFHVRVHGNPRTVDVARVQQDPAAA